MREIKFRGFRHDNNEVVVGSYKYYRPSYEHYIITWDSDYEQHIDIRVKPESVGEYTGLKDKNGKEIYEGDILSLDVYTCGSNIKEERISYIIFNKGSFETKTIKCPIFKKDSLAGVNPAESEIIGNIHQDKNLLK